MKYGNPFIEKHSRFVGGHLDPMAWFSYYLSLLAQGFFFARSNFRFATKSKRCGFVGHIFRIEEVCPPSANDCFVPYILYY